MTKATNTEEQTRNRRRWQAHLNAAEKSGLSRAEYCRRHNLSYHAMGYWYRKFSKKECGQTFVPFNMSIIRRDVQEYKPGLRLLLPGKISIAVEDNFSAATLEKLLTVLENR